MNKLAYNKDWKDHWEFYLNKIYYFLSYDNRKIPYLIQEDQKLIFEKCELILTYE